MLSKSQIDKIGDRLRQGSIDADAILALEAYRDEFTESYKYVERMFSGRIGPHRNRSSGQIHARDY